MYCAVHNHGFDDFLKTLHARYLSFSTVLLNVPGSLLLFLFPGGVYIVNLGKYSPTHVENSCPSHLYFLHFTTLMIFVDVSSVTLRFQRILRI